MKKEFYTTDAKFVYSKDELCYQEVLDDFEKASEILIITYNISDSDKDSNLISALKKVGEQCVVNIVTNIPGRWEIYYASNSRQKAKKKIKKYLLNLCPDTLGTDSKVFFNFSNHGKIVMTDSIVYVGSANYSDESEKNTEFGFISRDKKLIKYINSEILPIIQANALPYYDDYTALLLQVKEELLSVSRVKNELCEEVYRLYDDIEGEGWYYDNYEAALTEFTLDKVVRYLKEACKGASSIYDAIKKISSENDDEMNALDEIYEKIWSVYSEIEKMIGLNSLVQLSKFDLGEYIDQRLQEDCAAETYEENQGKCVERASDEAMGIIGELTYAAKKDIDKLIEKIQEFYEIYSSLIENLERIEIKNVNHRIDNT